MSRIPSGPYPFAVLREDGTPLALVKHGEDAAALVSVAGEGAYVVPADESGAILPTVVLYREGADGVAGDSYDEAALVMRRRAAKAGL